MPILKHLRVSIENARTKYDEFDDKQSRDQSTMTCVQSCFEVGHDQQFKIVLTTLPGFVWAGGSNGLIVTIDFDEGTKVSLLEPELPSYLILVSLTAALPTPPQKLQRHPAPSLVHLAF
jgi:hypothetical protein